MVKNLFFDSHFTSLLHYRIRHGLGWGKYPTKFKFNIIINDMKELK